MVAMLRGEREGMDCWTVGERERKKKEKERKQH
jgi:hypothetical protein